MFIQSNLVMTFSLTRVNSLAAVIYMLKISGLAWCWVVRIIFPKKKSIKEKKHWKNSRPAVVLSKIWPKESIFLLPYFTGVFKSHY